MVTAAISARTGDRADYGRRSAIIISVTIHLVALGGLYAASHGFKEDKPDIMTQTVKLGGPPTMRMSGAKRKAPVAGAERRKAQQRAPEKTVRKPPPEKPKPKPKEKVVGLNPEKPKKEPEPKPAEPAPSTAERAAKEPPPDPDPEPETSSAKALGGFGDKGKGVSLEVGDGSEDVNVEDLAFISYARTVLAEINSRWPGSSFESGATKIRFVIQRDGSITDVTVAESSGRGYLDGPARRAVMGAELPPLPQGYRGDYLAIKLTFQYGSDR